MGLGWLTQPFTGLHSYEANRGTCRVKPLPASAEECAYNMKEWRAFYTADWVYGRGTVYAFLILIAIAALAGFLKRVDRLPGRIDVLDSPTYRRASAFWRATTFQPRVGRFVVAPISILLLSFVTAAYFLLFTFVPQPLVWPNSRHGTSPPVATRSGWISLACLPFVLLFATKASLVTAVTGISHERLQIAHRFASYLMFASAIVHTVPLAVIGHHAGMAVDWTELYYWTGIAALIPQAWLTFGSELRRFGYEPFWVTHFVAAVLFVVRRVRFMPELISRCSCSSTAI